MTTEQEIRHIEHGAPPEAKPTKLGTVRFEVDCYGNAASVLRRCKEVLRAIDGNSGSIWPTVDEWRQILPEWFVVMCAKELSQEENEQWLDWWRKLRPEEQTQVEAKKKWSLAGWIYWFKPEHRQWYWWDAEVKSENRIVIAVEVGEWPFPWGSLRWFFIAAGATDVLAEN